MIYVIKLQILIAERERLKMDGMEFLQEYHFVGVNKTISMPKTASKK